MPMQLPEPLIPNAANQLSAYRDGYVIGQGQKQTATMEEAGGLAASGNMRGGANALMRGGLMAEGQAMLTKIQEGARTAKADSLKEASRKVDIIAQVAAASNDKNWGNNMAKLQELGFDTAKFADPATRDIAISLSTNAQEILKGEIERRKAEDGGKEKFGVNPGFAIDDQGNEVPVQYSDKGRARAPNLPEGLRFPSVEERKASAARGTAVGTAEGAAIVDLPKAEGNASVLLSKIDQVLEHPYLKSMTGPLDGRLPNVSGDASVVQSRVDQLTGDAFLQAFDGLKGGGAISEVEGSKAESAKSRLKTMSVNDDDYPVALKDFRNEVVRLRDLARSRAKNTGRGAAAAASPRSGPQPGHVDGGYRFKGGDPADKSNWEQVR